MGDTAKAFIDIVGTPALLAKTTNNLTVGCAGTGGLKLRSVNGNVNFEQQSNGALWTVLQKDVLWTVVGGSITETVTGAIPAGATVFGVTSRVTTTIVMATGVNFSIGISGTTDKWAPAGILLTAGTTTTSTDFKTATSPLTFKAATDILLTANAGTFTSGAIRLSIFYYTCSAPTS